MKSISDRARLLTKTNVTKKAVTPSAAIFGLLTMFCWQSLTAYAQDNPSRLEADPAATTVENDYISQELPQLAKIPGAEAFGFSYAAKYEITWTQYLPAVQEGGCRPPMMVWELERTTIDDERFRTHLPVVGINLEDIHCYLDWINAKYDRKFRLPTAEQWRWLAYRGAKTLFPWGDALEYDRANIVTPDIQWAFDVGKFGRPSHLTGTLPVGRFPADDAGLYDVIGNAVEIVGECEQVLRGHGYIANICYTMGGYSPSDNSVLNELPAKPTKRSLGRFGIGHDVGFRIIE